MDTKKVKEIGAMDKLRANLARRYKLLVPFLKVLFGISLERKSTSFIIEAVKKRKKPRSFFKARVYTLSMFLTKVGSASDKEMQKDEIRELLEVFPLLLSHIVMTNEKWYVGKIDDQPFDVFMAPERLVKIQGKNVEIYRGLHIQCKRLYVHPPRALTLKEWVAFVESVFKEKISNVDFGLNGHIHFYNCVALSESVEIKMLKSLFKKLYIPYNKYVDSISVSMELVSASGETTVVTLIVYPIVTDFVGVLDLDFERVKKIYVESEMDRLAIGALKQKVVLGNVYKNLHNTHSA